MNQHDLTITEASDIVNQIEQALPDIENAKISPSEIQQLEKIKL